MKRRIKLFLLLLAVAFTAHAQVQYVNPIIGTDGMGHTFPGACVPFGIVQLKKKFMSIVPDIVTTTPR